MKISVENSMGISMENPMEFNGIPLNFPWNSMEKYHGKNPSNVYGKFHGIYETEVDGIPWNSIDGISWNSVLTGRCWEVSVSFIRE
jgi:hypothetical protein